jgi:hypothetical protein
MGRVGAGPKQHQVKAAPKPAAPRRRVRPVKPRGQSGSQHVGGIGRTVVSRSRVRATTPQAPRTRMTTRSRRVAVARRQPLAEPGPLRVRPALTPAQREVRRAASRDRLNAQWNEYRSVLTENWAAHQAARESREESERRRRSMV